MAIASISLELVIVMRIHMEIPSGMVLSAIKQFVWMDVSTVLVIINQALVSA
jgi:hypothetical protein